MAGFKRSEYDLLALTNHSLGGYNWLQKVKVRAIYADHFPPIYDHGWLQMMRVKSICTEQLQPQRPQLATEGTSKSHFSPI